jgi:hypothetical protein
MTREQLGHIVRAICAVLQIKEIWIIGSQSILGSFSEVDLPPILTLSIEADFFVPGWSQQDENAIEATLGEVSIFAATHGYYADPVSEETACVPTGWKTRVVAFYNEATAGCTAWCLEPHDLAISKLAAGREKDLAFVGLLLENELVHESFLRELLKVDEDILPEKKAAILARLKRITKSREPTSSEN